MTPDQHTRLEGYRENLTDVVVHNCTPSGNLLRDMDKLYHEIYPTSAPTNFSCHACIFDMVRTLYNTLLKYA